LHLSDLCKSVHDWAVGKGWWDKSDRNFPEQLCLIHSEISEALEEYRVHGIDPKALLYTHHCKESGEYEFREGHKPEGIASELADAVIRICDIAGHYNIDLENAIEVKMAYNHTRAHRHGGKLA
jgi:NTP pyrophosphatase (non-canonical NTP hydrolase)